MTSRQAACAAALRAAGAIRTDAVEAVFATVPQHWFLPHFRFRANECRIDPDTIPDDAVLI